MAAIPPQPATKQDEKIYQIITKTLESIFDGPCMQQLMRRVAMTNPVTQAARKKLIKLAQNMVFHIAYVASCHMAVLRTQKLTEMQFATVLLSSIQSIFFNSEPMDDMNLNHYYLMSVGNFAECFKTANVVSKPTFYTRMVLNCLRNDICTKKGLSEDVLLDRHITQIMEGLTRDGLMSVVMAIRNNLKMQPEKTMDGNDVYMFRHQSGLAPVLAFLDDQMERAQMANLAEMMSDATNTKVTVTRETSSDIEAMADSIPCVVLDRAKMKTLLTVTLLAHKHRFLCFQDLMTSVPKEVMNMFAAALETLPLHVLTIVKSMLFFQLTQKSGLVPPRAAGNIVIDEVDMQYAIALATKFNVCSCDMFLEAAARKQQAVQIKVEMTDAEKHLRAHSVSIKGPRRARDCQ